MNKKISVWVLGALIISGNAFADITNFGLFKNAFTSETTDSDPISVGANIVFSSGIWISANSYVINTDFILDGGTTYDAAGDIDTAGCPGFTIIGGNQVFNDIDMQNFYTGYSGGAIYNNGGNVVINNGTFEKNYAFDDTVFASVNYGGAISNQVGNMTINDSVFTYNSSSGAGAVVNNDVININDSRFENNSGKSDHFALGTEGGAFTNYMNAMISNSSFINNTAYVGTLEAYGGAIFNSFTGNLTIMDTLFDGNSSENFGGAIYNDDGGILIIKNSVFSNNDATDLGGAIYNKSDLSIYADNGNTIFLNNTANSESNAIYNEGDIDLLANNGQIIFNDKITGTDTSSITIGNSSNSGAVVINNDMSGYLGEVTLQNGTLQFGTNGTMFGGGLIVDSVLGGQPTIGLQNGNLDNFDVSDITLNSDAYLAIDVNLATGMADNLSNLGAAGGTGNFIISDINLLDISTADPITVQLTDVPSNRLQLSSNLRTVSDGLFDYALNGNNLSTDGTLMFLATDTLSANNLGALAARNSHTVLLAEVSKQVLTVNHNDMYQIGLPNELGFIKTGPSVWVDVYGYDADIKHDNLTVQSKNYMGIAGMDIQGPRIGKLNTLFSAYGGYIGSEQNYDETRIIQNGWVAGLGGRIDYRQFFSHLTSNFITSYANGSNTYGDEDFKIYSTSVASKNGFNFEFYNDMFLLQPNVMVGYHFIHTKEYVNSVGTTISSDNSHALSITPEMKFGLNLGMGYKPYVAASYHWTHHSDTNSYAADNLLPELVIEDFTEFKLGLNKSAILGLNWFIEGMASVGNKQGFGGQMGLQWNF